MKNNSLYIFLFLFMCPMVCLLKGQENFSEKQYDDSLQNFHFSRNIHCSAVPSESLKLKLFFIGPYTHMAEADAMNSILGGTELQAAVTYRPNLIAHPGLPDNLILSRRKFTEVVRQKLQKEIEVIIIGKQPWENFTKEEQYLLLKKIHSGSGLLYFCPGKKDRYLNRLFTEKQLPVPPELQEEIQSFPGRTTFSRLGSGNIVFIEFSKEQKDSFQMLAPSRNSLYPEKAFSQYLKTTCKLAAWTQQKQIHFSTDALEKAKINTVTLNQNFFKSQDILQGKITLKQPASRAVISIHDHYKRLLTFQQINPAVSTDFQFKIPAPLHPLHHLEVQIFNKNSILQETIHQDFIVKKHSTEDLDFGMWITNGNGTYASSLLYKTLQQYGVNMIYTYYLPGKRPEVFTADAKNIVENNLLPMPYTTRIIFTGNAGKNMIRKPCLNDPVHRSNLLKTLKKQMGYWQYGPTYYSLGDENALSYLNNADVCCCPNCNHDFIRFLQKEYGTLEQLNEAWQSHYKNFKDIRPVLLSDALKKGNLIPWFMHRRHMDRNYADFHLFLGEYIRQFDSQALVGFEGSLCRSTWGGGNYEELGAANDFIADYENTSGNEMLITFGKEKLRKGMMAGGYQPFIDNIPRNQYIVWQNAFSCGKLLLYYRDHHFDWINGTRNGSALRADLKAFPWFQILAKEVQKLRQGPQRLLNESTPEATGIALYYNRTGEYALTALKKRSYLESYFRLLKDCGYQADTITANILASQGISPQKYPILLLPDSPYLSDKSIKIINHYMHEGGIVIAGHNPVKNDRNQLIKWEHPIHIFAPENLTKYKGDWGMGALPDFIYSAQGDALRINFSKYLSPARKFRTATITDKANRRLWDCEIRSYQCQAGKLLSVLRLPLPHSKPVSGTIQLRNKFHIYNLLQPEPPICTDSIDTRFEAGLPHLYLLSEKKIKKFECRADNKRIVFSSDQKGSSFFRIEVYSPQKELVKHYSGTHSLTSKGMIYSPAWALNDTGNWLIKIIDIVTRHQQILTINLGGKNK